MQKIGKHATIETPDPITAKQRARRAIPLLARANFDASHKSKNALKNKETNVRKNTQTENLFPITARKRGRRAIPLLACATFNAEKTETHPGNLQQTIQQKGQN